MTKVLTVRPIGRIARIADVLMVPIMYLVSGTFRERPQKTHAWNVQNLTAEGVKRLDKNMMFHCEGAQKAIARPHRWSFWFHIPIFGGWRNFVVLQPCCTDLWHVVWHVGWATVDKGAQISRVQLVGSVRMLIGDGNVSFFGVDSDGAQIPIVKSGGGCVGDGGSHSKIQLC